MKIKKVILQCIFNIYYYSHHACANNYPKILELLLSDKKIDINELYHGKNKIKKDEKILQSNKTSRKPSRKTSVASEPSAVQTPIEIEEEPVRNTMLNSRMVLRDLNLKLKIPSTRSSILVAAHKNNVSTSSPLRTPFPGTPASIDNSPDKKNFNDLNLNDDNNLISNPEIEEFIKSTPNKNENENEKNDDDKDKDLNVYCPLNLAVKAGNKDVITVLLQHGVNPMKVDGTGISPYGRALLKEVAAAVQETSKVDDEEEKEKEKEEEERKEKEKKERNSVRNSLLAGAYPTMIRESNALLLGDKSSRNSKFINNSMMQRCSNISEIHDESNLNKPKEKKKKKKHWWNWFKKSQYKSKVAHKYNTIQSIKCHYANLQIKEKWRNVISKELKDKKPNEQISTKIQNAEVVELLSKSPEVIKYRMGFGAKQFLLEVIFFLASYAFFLAFTPVIEDYRSSYVYKIIY